MPETPKSSFETLKMPVGRTFFLLIQANYRLNKLLEAPYNEPLSSDEILEVCRIMEHTHTLFSELSKHQKSDISVEDLEAKLREFETQITGVRTRVLEIEQAAKKKAKNNLN